MVTIIIPTHNHGKLINFAVQSVLNQTHEDFELFIIGDGPDAATRHAVDGISEPRVHYQEFPKAGRTGEPHRHKIIEKASGEFIFYLSDDDIWLPNHLEEMLKAIQGANFCHAPYTFVHPSGPGPNGHHPFQKLPENVNHLVSVNFIPLSCAAHSRELYLQLSEGWVHTPPNEPYTDHYMWKKFVAHPACKPVSSKHTTVINFPAYSRKGWTVERRFDEMTAWCRNHNLY